MIEYVTECFVWCDGHNCYSMQKLELSSDNDYDGDVAAENAGWEYVDKNTHLCPACKEKMNNAT